MENTQPHLRATATYAPVRGEKATPFSKQTVVLRKQDSLALTWAANDWRAHHARLVPREAALKAQGEALAAQRRDLTQRLSGKKSEQAASAEALGMSNEAHPRKRGPQPGTPGHGRRDRAALPGVVDVPDVSEAAQHCPLCGAPWAPCPGVAGGDMSAVQVQAHMRRIQRWRDHKTCAWAQLPGMVTAPPAPRGIPQSPLGVSVWTMVVLDQ